MSLYSKSIDNNFIIRDSYNLYQSPDIVPWGPKELDNPSYLLDTWHQDVGRNPTRGEINYVYVRAQNRTNVTQSTRIYLYVVVGGQLFTDPSSWTPLKAANNQDYVEISAGPDGRVVAPAAFRWKVPRDAPNHNCFVAIASNSDNPLPPGGFKSNAQFSYWASHNAGVAWRNVSLLPAGSATQIQKSLPFANLNDEPTRFGFWVEVTGHLDGLPSITAQCAEEGPDPKIDWEQPNSTTLFEVSRLPGHFKGILDVTVKLPDTYHSWPAGVDVATRYYDITAPPAMGLPGQMMMMGAFTVRG
ncbi:MAG: hypothetical protein AAF560_23595 [Acidobacteriota bacterium]